MLKHALKSAFYSLMYFRTFSIVNILGLSMGLTAFLLMMLYVMNERSYDSHWEDSHRLYHIQRILDVGQGEERAARDSTYLLPALEGYFSEEIESASRRFIYDMTGLRATDGSEPQTVDISYVEPAFIDIFQFELLQGDLQAVFNDTSSIALSRETATNLFGEQNPVGKRVSAEFFYIDGSKDYRVSAVYTLPEGNTVLSLPALALYDEEELMRIGYVRPRWVDHSVETFIKMSPSASVEAMKQRMPAFIDGSVVLREELAEALPPGGMPSAILSYEFIALEETYLAASQNAPYRYGNPLLVALFTLIAVLVLLVACANYVVLSLALAAGRQREMVMRKVLGASRWQLVLRFVSESLVITVIALIIAFSVQELVLPVFENFLGKDLILSAMGMEIFILAGLLLLVISVVNGAVPAFILVRKQPATTLKANQSTAASGNTRLRNLFVIFQFSVAIGLMVVTSVVFLQLYYVEGLNPGYDPDNLLVINTGDPALRNSQQVLLDEIRQLPQVESATSSGLSAGSDQGLDIGAAYERPGQSPGEGAGLPTLTVAYDFFRTFDIPLIAGRVYAPDLDPPEPMVPFAPPTEAALNFSGGKLVLNRAATEALGFSSPEGAIGQTVNSIGLVVDERRPFTIIGVVENNRFRSLRERPEPQAYRLSPEAAFSITLRFQGNPETMVAELSTAWEEVAGDIPLEYSFVGAEMAQVFNAERRQGQLFLLFSLLSIVIACLGLFAIAVYTAQSRTKEIGIRKSFGAEVREIVWLLIWQFSQPVFWASLIAWPLVLWVMHGWLQHFPYQVDFVLVLITALLASGLSIICAWATVGGTAAKAASAKPVLALRDE